MFRDDIRKGPGAGGLRSLSRKTLPGRNSEDVITVSENCDLCSLTLTLLFNFVNRDMIGGDF